jgi:hypothetical protein
MSEYPAHIQQAFNELHTGIRTGNQDLVASGRKRLAAAGIDPTVPERVAKAVSAGEQRKAAGVSETAPPQDRRAPAHDKTTVAADKPDKLTDKT